MTTAHDITGDSTAQLRADVRRLLKELPHLDRNLREMCEYEAAHPEYTWGWEPLAVHTDRRVCNLLTTKGILDLTHSNARGVANFRLRDREATLAVLDALEEAAAPVQDTRAPVDIDNLFSLIIRNDDAKHVLRLALKAKATVSVMLEGPPGVAKTLFLDDIALLPGAHRYGLSITKAGLLDLLFQEQPAILIIDELDKLPGADATPLLELMGGGLVTRLQHKRRESVHLQTRVFAGINDPTKLSKPLYDRFLKVRIPAYTEAEFIEVATQVLRLRHNIGDAVAALVVESLLPYTTSIREVEQFAELVRHDPRQIDAVIGAIWPESKRPLPLRQGQMFGGRPR